MNFAIIIPVSEKTSIIDWDLCRLFPRGKFFLWSSGVSPWKLDDRKCADSGGGLLLGDPTGGTSGKGGKKIGFGSGTCKIGISHDRFLHVIKLKRRKFRQRWIFMFKANCWKEQKNWKDLETQTHRLKLIYKHNFIGYHISRVEKKSKW